MWMEWVVFRVILIFPPPIPPCFTVHTSKTELAYFILDVLTDCSEGEV